MKSQFVSVFSTVRKTLSASLLAIMVLVLPETSHAQSCDKVNSIPVHTGWNSGYTSLIGSGGTDGNWTYHSATTALQTALGVGSSGALHQIPPYSPHWLTGSNRQWLSCGTSNSYGTVFVPNLNQYSMIAKREFRTCDDDWITFDFTVLGDNYVNGLWIDGVLQSFTQPTSAPGYLSNFNPGNPYNHTVFMTAGTHSIELRVGNLPDNLSQNWYGFAVEGFITSLGTSLVDVTSPANCSCAPPCGTLNRFNICTDPILNPFNYTFDIDISPASTQFSLDFGDGSPLFNGLSNATVPHTYAGAFNGMLALSITNANGDVCDVKRAVICLSANGAKQAVKSEPTQVNPEKAAATAPYPNPTKSSLFVPLQGSKGQVAVTILSRDGKVVTNKQAPANASSTLEIDTRELPAGFYLIRVTDASGTKTHSFVKE